MSDTRGHERKRFLVTGGAGFIGSRVVRLLAARPGCAVAIVDDLSVGRPMPQETENVSTHKIDIRDHEKLSGLFSRYRPDAVIHLAAIHHIPTCEAQRAFSLEVNVVGTENVLEAAAGEKVGRFVLASSGAVYDWVDGPLGEMSALRAQDNYSVAKLTNETQLQLWVRRSGGEGRVLRIFNTIGADDPNAHLIPDILRQLHSIGAHARIELGNIAPRRDYIDADDTARGIVAAATDRRTGVDLDTFNICSGEEISVEMLVRKIAHSMNIEITIAESPERKRRFDRVSQLGNPARASSILGWKAEISIQDSLRRIVDASLDRHEELHG